jgi:hypothetical protein
VENPTVIPPSQPAESGTTAVGSGSTARGAVLPQPPAVLPLRPRVEGEERDGVRGGTGRGSNNGTTAYKRYYRLLLPLPVPLNPTRRWLLRVEAAAVHDPHGSAACGLQAVLPPWQRYCRLWLTGGTTAGSAVLPLATVHTSSNRNMGCRRRVRDDPTQEIQCGPPLDSTVSPTTQDHQNRTGRDHASLLRASRGQNSLVPMNDSLKYLTHKISPQRHCHQSSKPLRENYALTISPFLVD